MREGIDLLSCCSEATNKKKMVRKEAILRILLLMTITMPATIALCPDGYDDGRKKSAYIFLVKVQTWVKRDFAFPQ